MKKTTIISCFAILATFSLFTIPENLYAFNYTISFTGTGASTSVESVVVQNLTKGTAVTVPTGNVLNLTDVATFVENINTSAETISVYPNPMQEKSNISFFAKSAGITLINVFSIEGKKIIGVNKNLPQGNRSFQLSMPKGVYIIQVQGNGFSYNAKAISHINSDCKAQIVFSENENQIARKTQKSKSAVTTMLYSSGDQLLYKGISGNYSTIVTDKPTESKTTNFVFVECKDADNNYYSVVKIGTQIWMAENLKTTKFRNGDNINNPLNINTWQNLYESGWCDFNNLSANGVKYGHLYNWYAVGDSRNISPLGWKVASDGDWTILENYLISNGFNYDESSIGNKIAKSLASTIDWNSSTTIGTMGNESNKNNKSGFSALPGSHRGYNGQFGDNNSGLLGNDSFWWTSTEQSIYNAYVRSIGYEPNTQRDFDTKSWGLYVRCILE